MTHYVFLWSDPTDPTGVLLRARNDAVHQSACVREEKSERVQTDRV